MSLGAFGTHLDSGAVEAEAVRALADRMLPPKHGEQLATASSCHVPRLKTYAELCDMCGVGHIELAFSVAS